SRFYLPASRQGRRYADDSFAGAKTISAWKARIRAAWPGVSLRRLDTPPARLNFGESMKVELGVELNGLATDDVMVEMLLSPPNHAVYLSLDGTHARLYRAFGSHLDEVAGQSGASFTVWAPNAERVSVIGEFNGWDAGQAVLTVRQDGSGIWEGFVSGVTRGQAYKYRIASARTGQTMDKADPYAFFAEAPPATASR